jgi:hypothetical protein
LLQKPILAIVNVEAKVQYQRAQAWQQVFFLFFFFFLFSFLEKYSISALRRGNRSFSSSFSFSFFLFSGKVQDQRAQVATGLCVADVFRRQT